ncbi:lipoyl(octanoyl) transferase LipB [Sphingomonas sp. 1P06PA]|uniref:lipoyl(octanoyl) transferase LipB n=1 Tax=Sphingomonas sp. 1P06PA TaxID=554121 RepID=UPI0039A5ED30
MDMIDGVEWRTAPGLTAYPDALAEMERRAADIRNAGAAERVWLVEHPPLYTAGTSAAIDELVAPGRFPVFPAGRGGRYTYHGPGQRTGYLMLDLDRRGRDVRRFVSSLEAWLVETLGEIGVSAFVAPGRIGVWVATGGTEAKIGAIGVRVKRWVTLHGFAVNIHPDLDHFSGIVPCGIADYPVTSLHALGIDIGMEAFDAALHQRFSAFLARLAAPSDGT